MASEVMKLIFIVVDVSYNSIIRDAIKRVFVR